MAFGPLIRFSAGKPMLTRWPRNHKPGITTRGANNMNRETHAIAGDTEDGSAVAEYPQEEFFEGLAVAFAEEAARIPHHEIHRLGHTNRGGCARSISIQLQVKLQSICP